MKIKSAFLVALAAVTVFGAARAYYRLTDDFRWANITYELSHRADWEGTAPNVDEVAATKVILNQPFHYIGKGAQSYAFASADGQYVLKFFKFKHLRPTPFLNALSAIPAIDSYHQKQTVRKQRKLEGVFAGYRLAFDRHREDSGLLFVHLNTTKGQFPVVKLYDKIGLSHQIPLDEVPFVLQYKVQTVRQVLQPLLAAGDLATAKLRLAQVFELYRREYEKGIIDHDHGVMRNIGFAGEKPIHLDVGKLHDEPSIHEAERQIADLEIVASRMQGFFRQQGDELCQQLTAYVAELVAAHTAELRHTNGSL